MTGPGYCPSDSPFDLPVSIYRFHCALERPFEPPHREGANLATTFRGAYGEALVEAGCMRAPGPRCEGDCARPDSCPVQRLRPTAHSHSGTHSPSPVLLRVERSWLEGRAALSGEMILWGRLARGFAALALAALETTGRRGLLSEGTPVRFDAFSSKTFDGSLRRWVTEAFPAGAPPELVFELAEPCSSAAVPRDSVTVDVARLAGEAAYQLVRWDLEDRREAQMLGEETCDRAADEAREAARASFAAVSVESSVLSWRSLGARRSGTNPGRVRLEGNVGYARLAGDLSPALPWLAVLALRGAGGHTSHGLGRVGLWVPPREPERVTLRVAPPATARPRAVLLLVGDQRIPNAIPVLQEPGLREAVLVSTDDVAAASDDLRSWLGSRGLSVNAVRVDPHDYASLRASLATVLPLYEPGALLVNVTGGTKIMSLAAADAAREHGHRAVYVDTQHGVIREIHPGAPSAPIAVRFRVEDFFLLHGQPWKGVSRPSRQESALCREIARDFGAAFDLIQRLKVPDGSEVSAAPGEESLVRLCLEAGVLDRAGKALLARDGSLFAQNRWLECLAYTACKDAGCDDAAWRAPVEGTATDFDVVATKGPLLLVVSCKSGKTVKGDELDKLEAQARRVGGSFCRKLFLRVEVGEWRDRGGRGAHEARRAFDARARALGIATLYWEAFPRLSSKVASLFDQMPGSAVRGRSTAPR